MYLVVYPRIRFVAVFGIGVTMKEASGRGRGGTRKGGGGGQGSRHRYRKSINASEAAAAIDDVPCPMGCAHRIHSGEVGCCTL